MSWSKILLVFQAIVTLLIGVAFFFQLTHIGFSNISEVKETIMSQGNLSMNSARTLSNIRGRFTIASYFLFNIGLIELVIILRLIN